MAFIDTATRSQLIELYVAYFNRAPDADGLAYWSDKVANGGWKVATVARSFMDQTEVKSTYPDYMTSSEIVDKVYTNVLNRAADADGKTYWVNQLNTGKVTKADLIQAVVNAAKSTTGTATDAATLANKTSVGEYFAVTLGSNDKAAAASIMTGVTSDAASVTAAKASSTAANGQTFMLTTGTDNITGTTGNDTINATGTTLTALDVINGGAGTDTLKVVDAAGVMNTTIPAGLNITNVEKMEIQTSGNLGRTAGEGTTESAMVQFQDLAQGLTLNLGGRVITATGGTATAADIATAFTSGTTTNNAAVSGALTGWTVAAGGSTQQAKFTSTTPDSNVSDLVATGFAVTGKPAVNQASTVLVTAGTTNTTDTISFVYNGVNLTTAQTGATTDVAAATAIANAINNYAAQTIATTSGTATVTISSPFVVSLANFAGTGATFGAFTTTQAYTAAVPAAAPTLVITQGAAPSTTAAAYDVSGIASLTDVSITGVAGMGLKAATTQNVTVSGSTGTITVDGGKDVTVTDATADKNITIGATTVNAGKITVTDSKQGTGSIAVDGGTDVTITATVNKANSGTITVGQGGAATDSPSGSVVITDNLNSDGTAAMTGGNITVTGGKTINVTINATQTATVETAASAITNGDVRINSGATTTDVTVNQTKTLNQFTKAAVPVVKETDVVTFKALKSGEAITVNGLTFTASKDLTAEQTAAAFANLTAADIQTAGGPTANGIYTGAFNTAVWTSSAVSGATVTFTAQDHDEADLVFSGTGTTNDAGARAPVQAKTAGTAAVAEAKSTASVTYGSVRVDGEATNTLKTVTVDGYKGADLGVTGTDLNGLTTLSLANSAGNAAVATSATTLAMTLNKVAHAVNISGASAGVATLNVTTTGSNSAFALTAAHVKELNVGGDKALNLTGSTLSALESVKVTGTAGLNLGAVLAAKSIDTTATTGAVTATINGTAATYTGGAGVDTVTLATGTALTKSIDLGAGDDTLVFDAAVTGSSATLSGGAGVDTLSMSVARADALDASVVSFYTNFERLKLNDAAGTNDGTTDTVTVNVENLGFTNYVTTSGTNSGAGGARDILVLDKLANNATVVLTALGSVTAQIKDAATGTADVLNVVANVAANSIDFGTLTAANVETVNITANDTLADDNEDGTTTAAEAVVEKSILILTANKATTVNLTGSADVDLTLTGSDKVTLIDGSSMTGALNVTSVSTASAIVIKGGSANDTLVADASSTKADELHGGAGNDSLTANAGMTKMYGGAGSDTFNIVVASTNVNSAATIMDIGTGDVIKFAGADAFKSAAITLDTTAVFQDFANAAIASITSNNDLAWFQFGGNTYIVQEKDASTNANVFVNNEDFIVKIAGLVDLSTASFNATSGTLEIA